MTGILAALVPVIKLIIQAVLPLLMGRVGDTAEESKTDTALLDRLRRRIAG